VSVTVNQTTQHDIPKDLNLGYCFCFTSFVKAKLFCYDLLSFHTELDMIYIWCFIMSPVWVTVNQTTQHDIPKDLNLGYCFCFTSFMKASVISLSELDYQVHMMKTV